jgi:hypothetical protein
LAPILFPVLARAPRHFSNQPEAVNEGCELSSAEYSAFYAFATLEQVTVLAAAGDNGTSNEETDGVTF